MSLPQDSSFVATLIPSEDIPSKVPVGFEAFMLSQDKMYVVVAVVLVIWLGILFYLYQTDRRIAKLERLAAEQHSEPSSRS